MRNKKYKLEILPLFEEDLNEVVDYISYRLCNPHAAMDLVNEVEKVILKRLSSPESYEPYLSLKEREYPYYRIYIKLHYILCCNR